MSAAPGSGSPPLVSVRDLTKHYAVRRSGFGRPSGAVRAVDGVSFDIGRGETLGLVGESGSGKSTTGRVLLRLEEPTAGSVRFDGEDVMALDREGLQALRRRAQIVFQDPYASLNPRMTVGAALREVLAVHRLARGNAAQRRVGELLDLVGLPRSHASRYPHEFSGGQRQRVGIARALSVEPDFLVCDEPVSALDVSVQAQVLNLLDGLQRDLGIALLFIAHDLSVVEHVSDRVAVMYLGRLVEIAPARSLYTDPRHPYTRALLSAVPRPEPGARRSHTPLEGDIPDPSDPPPGCPFHPRCPDPRKDEECIRIVPALVQIGERRAVACLKEAGVRDGVAAGQIEPVESDSSGDVG